MRPVPHRVLLIAFMLAFGVPTRASAQMPLIFPALISLACVVAGYSLLVVGIRRSTGARGYALALQSLAVFLLAEIAASSCLSPCADQRGTTR